MTFRPSLWYPIAVGLTVLNLGGVAFATMEPWHATVHAGLAVAFGLWAQRLRRQGLSLREGATDTTEKIGAPLQEHLEAIEAEMNQLRRELSETQERLDFAERVLAQERDKRQMGPQR